MIKQVPPVPAPLSFNDDFIDFLELVRLNLTNKESFTPNIAGLSSASSSGSVSVMGNIAFMSIDIVDASGSGTLEVPYEAVNDGSFNVVNKDTNLGINIAPVSGNFIYLDSIPLSNINISGNYFVR